ncbi:MAG TPA: phosphoglycerate kinase [Patescibacteria group bacterium]|nr:phosphoglycerate kinase [Patescibacteria group bacterium]
MAVKKLGVQDVDVANKRVFVRVDFNVPIEDGKITDDTRIVESLRTIRHLLKNGAKVVLASHLGRPKGKRNPEFSLAPVAKRLSELLGQNVPLARDCVGIDVVEQVNDLNAGDVLLLENLRFHAEEEANDPQFSKELACFAALYVNDAFGTAHRAHASTVGVPELVKPAVAGFLMQKELFYLGNLLTNPKRPFYALLGGGPKVTEKIGILKNLLEIADGVLIGGAMAYPFLVERGWSVGGALVEQEIRPSVRAILNAVRGGPKFVELPQDHVITQSFAGDAEAWVTRGTDILGPHIGMDIGPVTTNFYGDVLKRAKTVFWNGPLGVYEFEKFAAGTNTVAKVLGESNATVIIGGGDVVAAVHKAGVADKMAHISTGGGASLEFIEGKELPGVVALTDK